MAYTSGDTILDTHYNGFANSVNALWGTGSGDRGYGQTDTVSTVSDGTTIQATQWATLMNRIRSISDHTGQDGSITVDTVSNPSAGDTISAFATISADIGTIDTAAAAQTNSAGLQSNSTNNVDSTATLTNALTQTSTYTFASANQMRHFFNAGGRIQISWDIFSYTSDTKAERWNTLAEACGTYQIFGKSSGKTGGSGTTSVNYTAEGFHNMGTGQTQTFKQFAASTYTANYIDLHTNINAAVGSATVMTIQSRWVDDEADQTSYNKNIYNVLDQTDGTKRTTFAIAKPNTTYLTDNVGTITYTNTVNSHS